MPENKENKPVLTLKDGFLKATTWRNVSEKGDSFYTTTFTRSYKGEDGKYHDTHTFSQQDLLKVAELGRQTYNRVADLKREADRSRQSRDAERPAQRSRARDYERRGR